MAIQAKNVDIELARAFFRQASFDVLNAEVIAANKERLNNANAVAMAQLQQGCEKTLKAWIILKAGRSVYMKPTHWVWSSDLQNDSLNDKTWNKNFRSQDLKQLRDELARIVSHSSLTVLQELESYAPFRSWNRPNSEYPWIDANGAVAIPVDFFDSIKVTKFKKLSREIVKLVANDSTELRNEWLTVKAVFG